MLLFLFGLLLGAALVYGWRASVIAKYAAEISSLTRQLIESAAVAELRLADARRGFDELLATERAARVTQLDQQKMFDEKLLGEQRAQFDARLADERTTREKILTEFRAAAGDTLKESTKQYLDEAIKDLRLVKTETDSSVTEQQKLITSSVSEMKSQLEDYHKLVRTFEDERGSIYAKLEQQLSQLANTEEYLRKETTSLRTALTTGTATSGQWGEMVLRTILMDNGFEPGINFEEQVTMPGDDGAKLRPDFLIKLPPGDHRQVIDAKSALLERFISAQETDDPQLRESLYREFAGLLRTRIKELAGKEYQRFVDPDVPHVVMFIPSEAAVRVAFSTDRELFQYAMSQKIIIASPATIIPLIMLIAHAWKQQKLAENARELGAVVEELGDRLGTFVDHLGKVQGGLRSAADNWNKAVGSWERNVTPQLERVITLGGKVKSLNGMSEVPGDLRSLGNSSEEAPPPHDAE